MIRLNDKTEAALEAILRAASKTVAETALSTEADIKQSMATSPATGTTYKRKGRVHTASARGNAPRIDTGVLANSISTDFDGDLIAEVGTGVEYSQFVEVNHDRPAFQKAGEKARNTFRRNARTNQL